MNKELWIIDTDADRMKEIESGYITLSLKEIAAKFHKFLLLRDKKSGRIEHIGKINHFYPAADIYTLHFSSVYPLEKKINCKGPEKKIIRSITFEEMLFSHESHFLRSPQTLKHQCTLIPINEALSKKIGLPPEVPFIEEDYDTYKVVKNIIPIAFVIRGIEKYILIAQSGKYYREYKNFIINFYLNQAVEFVTRKDYEKALDFAANVLMIDPYQFLAHFQIANILMEFSNFDHAISHYKIASKYNKSDIEIENYLGMAYARKNDSKTAMRIWNKLLKTDPKNISVLTNIAELQVKNKKFKKAIDTYNSIISLDPDNYYAKNSLGIVYASSDDPEKAAEIWSELINTKYDNEFLHFNMGQAFMEQKKYKEAYKEYTKVVDIIEEKGDFGELAQLKQMAEALIEKIEQEITELKEKERNPDQELLKDVSFLSFQPHLSPENRQELEEALEEALRMLEETPDDEWVYYSVGSIYYQLGELKKSYEHLKKSLEIEPNNNVVYHTLGSVAARMGNIEEAVTLFKKVIITKPPAEYIEIYEKWKYDSNTAYFNLGDCYIQLNKLDEAIECFKKGLEYDVKSFLAHFQLATCYEAKMLPEKAIQSYKNAILLNSEFDMAYLRLGNLYFHLKDWNNAASALTDILEKFPDSEVAEQAEILLSQIPQN